MVDLKNWKFRIVIIIIVSALFALLATPTCSFNSTSSTEQAASTVSLDVESTNSFNSQQYKSNKQSNYEIIETNDVRNPLYLIGKALSKTKRNLLTSLILLFLWWIILSFIYFLFERRAQPDVYRNYGVSFLWTIVKSIRDPGEMAPHKPVTIAGKIVANIIGVLAIIIVAIPTGILSSGFVKVMDEEAKKEQILINIERIKKEFRWSDHIGSGGSNNLEKLYLVPDYKDINTFLTRKNLSTDDVIEAVRHTPELRLDNWATHLNNEDNPDEKLVVVACPPINRPYGYCVDRGSKVTIVSTSGYVEPLTSWVAYHIAKIGGFNYVAREVELDIDSHVSYYKFDDEDIDDNLKCFLDDINRLSSRQGSWVIPMAFCAGPKSRKHKFHLVYSYTKGDDHYNLASNTIRDTTTFESLFEDMDSTMVERFNTPCDKNTYYYVPKEQTLAKRLKCKNVFFFRAENHAICFSSKRVDMIITIANVFNQHLEPGVKKHLPEEMVTMPKGAYGYRYYKD